MKFIPATIVPNKDDSGIGKLLESHLAMKQKPCKVCVIAEESFPALQLSGLTCAQAYKILSEEFSSRKGYIVSELNGKIVYIQ